MYDYYRDNMGAMPVQNQYNPMMAMPVQQYNPMMMPVQNQYNPMMTMPMQNQYNPMMTMPAQNKPNPASVMPKQQLENLYPATYNIIKPAAKKECDKMMGKDGQMRIPTQSELESMVNNVYENVQPNVEATVTKGAKPEERQFYGGGRRLLRDFITVVLLADLLGRNRPFYPGYFGGYGFGYGYPYTLY